MPQLTILQALQLALDHHQAGRQGEAESLCRQILASQSNHPDALYILGLVVHQTGHSNEAIRLIRQALTITPNYPVYHANLGDILLSQGQIEEALASLQQTVALLPNSPDAHYNLGNAWCRKGDIDQAILFYQKSLALNPNFAPALNNLGNIFKEQNHLDQALACFQKAIHSDPNFFTAYNNLGATYHQQGRFDQAILFYQKAIALHPDYPDALSNLSVSFKAQRRFDEALTALHRALTLNPNHFEAHNNLGTTLYELDRFDEAIASYRQTLTLNPNHFEATNNLGNALLEQGHLESALTLANQSLALNPNYVLAHFSRAVILLLKGDFQEGWQEYEWRWQWKDFPSLPRSFTQPLFFDQDPAGKTILLHTEQGLGDAIQFARYIPLLAARGATVIIECHPALRQLFQTLPGVTSIHDTDTTLPPFDFQAPFLSLPRAFGTTLNTIPTNTPYLQADPQKISHWKNYLTTHTSKNPHAKKIGLVWSGNPSHPNDHRRSLPLSVFAPLFNLPNTQFISLQKGPPATQLTPTNFPLLNPTDQLPDFTDTAALLSSLNLLITVDTAVAHLAGALALPVWLLLPFASDWRWLEHRTDSPWYPTMKLFRQPTPADWPSVIQSLTQELRQSPAISTV